MTPRRSLLLLTCILLALYSCSAQWRTADRPSSGILIQTAEPQATEHRSVLLAGVLSAILPGMGEWYAGDFGSGAISLSADGLLWMSYAGMKLQSKWIRDDARTAAVQNAQAQMAGKDAAFEVNIGNYMTTDEYNQAMLRNRQYDQVYSSPSSQWQWQSEQLRSDYRGMRIRSDEWNNNAKFAIAGLVVNRIVSVFAAARKAARFNRGLTETGWDLQVRVAEDAPRSDVVNVEFRTTL